MQFQQYTQLTKPHSVSAVATKKPALSLGTHFPVLPSTPRLLSLHSSLATDDPPDCVIIQTTNAVDTLPCHHAENGRC